MQVLSVVSVQFRASFWGAWMRIVPVFAAMLCGIAASVPAIAQAGGDVPATAPAPSSGPAPICTDRPTKANVVCTVPAGSFQLETDVVNWTRNHDAGVTSDMILYTNPYLKYGLGSRTDIEFNIAPYETVRTGSSGMHDTVGGVGDLYVRLKQQLTDGSGKIQAAIIPFVKAPVARRGIGNREWEGGIALPIIFSLPQGFTLNLGPEGDVIADSDGHGKHAQFVTAVNLSKSFGKATIYTELWTAQNFDRAGTIRQYSADVAVAYLILPLWQVDVGGNFGLNHYTPDAQAYLGLSTRF